MREVITSILKTIEDDSWQERTEHFFRVNAVDSKTGYALSREIGIRPENPRGITKADAIRMMGKDKRSSVYEVTIHIKRIA